MAGYQRYLSKLRAHMKAAKAYADLSYATRLKVGAVIIKNERPISNGRNGMPAGESKICELVENGALLTRPEVLHAESNAITYAARYGSATDGATLITTHSPCFDCCKLIVQAGIIHVVYETEYRDTSGLKFLEDYGVKVTKIHDD